MPAPELILWSLIGVSVLVAAGFDLKRRVVPAWISWPTLVVALLVRLGLEGVGSVEQGLLSGVLGALACAAPFALLAMTGPRVGWNDVKLLAAVGAGFGIPRALSAVFLISVAGAGAALFFVLWKRRWSDSVSRAESKGEPRGAVDSARSIPYGVPIAIGALWAMAWVGPAVPELQEGAPDIEVGLLDGGVPAEEVEL